MDEICVLKSLADETRFKIVTMLSKENLCACQLLEEFEISQATLSYHMKQLQECSLVIGKKDGYWTRYSLNKNKLKEILSVFDDLLLDNEIASPPIQCKE